MTRPPETPRLRHWQRWLAGLGVLLFVAIVAIGPYLAYGLLQKQNRTLSDTDALVRYVGTIQASPQARVLRESSTWQVAALAALCAAVHAHCPPLPPDLAQALRHDPQGHR